MAVKEKGLHVYNLYRTRIDPDIYSEILSLTKTENVNVHSALESKYKFNMIKMALNNLIAADLVRSCSFPNGHLISQKHKS